MSDGQTAHFYILRKSRENRFSVHKMRNNGSILVCNRVESIFGYLARHRKPYGYVKCRKNINQA